MTDISSVDGVSAPATTGSTRVLLYCGVVAAPLFVTAILVQGITRTGFDFKVHALSQLSLGGLGWIQTTNFIISGLLFVAAAVGMRRALDPRRAGSWGPRLVGAFGASLVWAGLFVADPAHGFPPGTPAGAPEQLSWHGALHSVGPLVGGMALLVACFIFARRFAGQRQRGWAAYCVGTVLADVALSGVGFGGGDFRFALAGGALLWLWASVMAARLIYEHATD